LSFAIRKLKTLLFSPKTLLFSPVFYFQTKKTAIFCANGQGVGGLGARELGSRPCPVPMSLSEKVLFLSFTVTRNSGDGGLVVRGVREVQKNKIHLVTPIFGLFESTVGQIKGL
jgi:hypothetical protein